MTHFPWCASMQECLLYILSITYTSILPGPEEMHRSLQRMQLDVREVGLRVYPRCIALTFIPKLASTKTISKHEKGLRPLYGNGCQRSSYLLLSRFCFIPKFGVADTTITSFGVVSFEYEIIRPQSPSLCFVVCFLVLINFVGG